MYQSNFSSSLIENRKLKNVQGFLNFLKERSRYFPEAFFVKNAFWAN